MPAGRKQKPFQTSWGDIIPGLARGNDHRWRIVATGERFRESDERRAVARFRQWQAENAKPTTERVRRMLQPKANHVEPFDKLVGGLCALDKFSEQLGPEEGRNLRVD